MLSIICPWELWERIESVAPCRWWTPHFCLTAPCQWRLPVVPWQTGWGGPDKPTNIQPNTNKVLVQCDLFILLIYLFQAKSKLSQHWLVLPWKWNTDKNQTVFFYALGRLIGKAILLVFNFVWPTVVCGESWPLCSMEAFITRCLWHRKQTFGHSGGRGGWVELRE